MTQRRNIGSGTEWEAFVGYSRAVRVGNRVDVAGTVAVDEDGHVVGVGDMYAQTKYILEKVGQALEEAGASFADVVRTRMFVTNISLWKEAGRAHGEVFGDIRPVATMVEVTALIHPDHLIEIEVEAMVSK